MIEKISIRKFGPIDKIDLELKKVNILIGEQGTGKSALAKLLYVFNKREFVFAGDNEKDYLIESYGLFFKKNTEIQYSTKHYSISFLKGKFKVSFAEDKGSENLRKIYDLSKPLTKNDELALKKWFNYRDWILKDGSEYMYVPAERIALLTTLRLIRETTNRSFYQGNFDQYILDFANKYEKATEKITSLKIPHLNGVTYEKVSGIEKIKFKNDNLFLYQTSSGFQASIPLAIFLEYYTKSKKIVNKFIIEEPELNLFPYTQYELIKYFAEKINTSPNSMLLTTHSPYVLTSINNLLYAYKVGTKKGNQIKVAKIIDKKNWINPRDVSAYRLLPNGKIEDIFDKELSMIMAEKIDEVSSQINNEYDRISEIKYGK